MPFFGRIHFCARHVGELDGGVGGEVDSYRSEESKRAELSGVSRKIDDRCKRFIFRMRGYDCQENICLLFWDYPKFSLLVNNKP